MAGFNSCLAGEVKPLIRQDLADAAKAGANATPTFFVGTRQPDGTLKALRIIRGAQSYAAFQTALDNALNEAAAASPTRQPK